MCNSSSFICQPVFQNFYFHPESPSNFPNFQNVRAWRSQREILLVFRDERRATSVEAASSPSSWSTYRGTSSRALGWVTKRIIGTVADRTNSNFLAAWSDLYIISLSPIYHRSRDNYSKVYPSLTVLTGSTCDLDTRPSTLRCIPRGRPPSPTAERSNS